MLTNFIKIRFKRKDTINRMLVNKPNECTFSSFNGGLLHCLLPLLLLFNAQRFVYSSSSSFTSSFVGSSSKTSSSSSSSSSLSDQYFQIKPSDLYVIEGESAELKCQISSIADAGPVQWAKDGFLLGYQPIIPGYDRYTMSVNESSRTYNLHISNVQLEDEAEFECQTTSRADSSTKHPIRAAAFLHLIVAPKSIVINSTTSSSSSINTNKNLPYSNQSGFNSGQSLSTNGTNGNTFHSHSNTFIVDAHEGEKIVIICSVSHSKPPPRLKWYRKNIELLPEAAKTAISKTLFANRHTLYSVESSLVLYPKFDEEYRCQVEHGGLSKPLRATAQINIMRRPNSPVIDGYQNGDVINFQEKLTLKCTSNGGYPPPSVIWLRNGVEIDRTFAISPFPRHEVVNSLSFVVEHADNMATFTCQVSNLLTPVPLQQSIILNVLLYPTHVRIVGPSQVRLMEPHGVTVTLECQAYPASSQPNESKIRWLIDGREVLNVDDEMNYVHVVKLDQQSWTIRSNLTFVVNSKEPNMRNVVCIAYSSSGKSETISASHQISVIYPPELPTLLGVKNGLATVVAGEIFKCKCVSYSGNPRPNLLWYNHQNREISALTTTTGSGISTELVIRPTANDHGAVFRCHVQHPTLEKPYEVSFKLQIIFPPEHLNITFPKFIKENDTIKIECTASRSNPCPTITLLKNGIKIDETTNNGTADSVMIEKIVNHDNSWNHHPHPHQQQLKQQKMMGRRRNHIKSNGNAERVQSYRSGSIDTVDDDVDDDDGDVDDDVDVKDEPWNRQSVRTESTIYHKTDCASLHNHNNGSIVTMMATGMASVKAVVSLVATVSDDGSELTCLARNNLISDHVIRTSKRLIVHYKPKFNNYINFIQLDEHESRQLDVMVRANPSVDNLVFNRVKETTSQSASRTNVTQYQQRVTILDDLIDDYANISWMVEPMPTHWSFILTGDQIRLNIVNVTAIDSGLYMARVSNTLGDSVFFTRIHVKTLSSIKSIRISSSSSTSSASLASSSNQTTSTIREGDAYFTIECQVNANPSIAIQWTKQYSMNHWDLSRSRSSFNDTEPYFNNGPLFVNEDESIDSNAIDWNRSNVSQTQPFYGGSDLSAQLIVSRLTIGNVRFTDSGVYSCITPNDTRTIQVNIEHRPRIMAGFGSPIVATDYGSSVSAVKFVCTVSAFPDVQFNWTINDSTKQRSIKIGSNSKYQLMTRNGQLGSHRSSDQSDNQHFTSELIIHHITEQDYGQYQCEAYNRFGSDQSMFELVRKRHPETPKNIQVINVTQNSAFLTWRPGFDYGYDQQYQLTLWHLSEEHRKQIEANKYDESDESMFEHLPSRTYPNMTVSHLLLSNLEPNTYYRVSLISFNRLGQSDRSVSTIIHTSTKSANYVHDKTAIPSEQRLNGLNVVNVIMGEEFIELSVILCLITVTLCITIISTVVYCRRRSQRHSSLATVADSSSSSASTSCSNQYSNNNDSHHLQQQQQLPNISNKFDYTNPIDTTPTVSSSLSTQLTSMGQLSSDLTNTNSLSTNVSYMVKDVSDPNTYLPSQYHCQPMPANYDPNQYLSTTEKGKIYSDYLTLSTMNVSNDNSQHHHLARAHHHQAEIYPFELTDSCTGNNGSNKNEQTVTAEFAANNFQLLLSHQQITNVHLLPDNLEGVSGESICLTHTDHHHHHQQQQHSHHHHHHHHSQLATTNADSAAGYVSFTSLPYDNKSGNVGPLSTFELASPSTPYQGTTTSDPTSQQQQQQQQQATQSYTFNELIDSNQFNMTYCGDESIKTLTEMSQTSNPMKRVKLVKVAASPTSSTVNDGVNNQSTMMATLNEEDEV